MQSDNHYHLSDTGPDNGHYRDQNQDIGKAHPGVDEALHQNVVLATEERAWNTDQQRDSDGQQGGKYPYNHGHSSSVDDAAEHVSSQRIGAENVLGRRWAQPVGRMRLIDAVRGQNRCENSGHQKDENYDSS